MNPNLHAAIRKASSFAVILTLLACTAASCRPQTPVIGEPHCAFADPELMTALGISTLAAEYYVAHHEWPLSQVQLHDQLDKMLEDDKEEMLEETKGEMPPEEVNQEAKFLERFTLLEMRKTGRNLVIHYRFRIDTPAVSRYKIEPKMVDQTVHLKPRSTADEILQAASFAPALQCQNVMGVW